MKKELIKLKDTHQPFTDQMDKLLMMKKQGLATIIKARLILQRAFMKALEVGFEEGMAWQINKERRAK